MSLYFCNPRKHETCPGGRECQVNCFLTTNPEYSDDGIELTEEDLGNLEVHRLALARGKDLTDDDMDDADDDTEKEKTVAEIIEDVKTEICMNYCKYPVTWDEEKEGCQLFESDICKNCPLNRL